LEGLNEQELVNISTFLHYSLFIIACSASSLPKIVFTACFYSDFHSHKYSF